MIVWVTVIIAVQAVALLLIQGHQRRAEKREDYRRQDLVAARAAEAAHLLEQRQEESDRQGAETAAKLLERQDAIAAQAAEAARLLVANNEQVASSNADTKASLTQIHTLVNSDMTSRMESELAAKRENLVLLREVIELHRAAGREPTTEALATIDAVEAKIAELSNLLAERVAKTKIAEAQAPPRSASTVPP
jgi:hypothetical protein